ncbi:unnamed protein product, partial [Vitis vinifera]|uniref:Uncharacterized protein n=1 Tax=Vitis vinifera TaxID=29760 RepID=D7TYS2_VITVI
MRMRGLTLVLVILLVLLAHKKSVQFNKGIAQSNSSDSKVISIAHLLKHLLILAIVW